METTVEWSRFALTGLLARTYTLLCVIYKQKYMTKEQIKLILLALGIFILGLFLNSLYGIEPYQL